MRIESLSSPSSLMRRKEEGLSTDELREVEDFSVSAFVFFGADFVLEDVALGVDGLSPGLIVGYGSARGAEVRRAALGIVVVG